MISPVICIQPLSAPRRTRFAGFTTGSIRTTGTPRSVTRIGSFVLCTSFSSPMHLALNSETGIVFIAATSISVARLRQNSAELSFIRAQISVQFFQHPRTPGLAFQFPRISFFRKLCSVDCFQARGQLICAEFSSLLRNATRFVQSCDGAPIQIAFRIEAPVRGNKNHCSERCQIRRQLEEQWTITTHSIEMPSLAKHIENSMKAVHCLRPANRPVLAHATLGDEPASNDSFVISELRHIEMGFN